MVAELYLLFTVRITETRNRQAPSSWLSITPEIRGVEFCSLTINTDDPLGCSNTVVIHCFARVDPPVLVADRKES